MLLPTDTDTDTGSPPRRRPTVGTAFGRIAVTVALAFAGLACGKRANVPDAELLVISNDSTFWVTSRGGAVRIRGVPMLVARVDGKFRELYVSDDDRSYFDALFVGFRLFSRDLERRDSLELRRDTVVQQLARDYARRHPSDSVLSPDEPENDNPSIHAEGDIEILGLHGPYLSYEHHTDIDSRGENAWAGHRHSVRRGVLDIRTGREVLLSDLFARPIADSAVAAGRSEWKRDEASLLAARGVPVMRPGGAITGVDYVFNPESFSLGSDGQSLTMRFAIPGLSTKGDVEAIEMTARPMPAPAWWREVADGLPRESGDKEIWSRAGDTLVVTANRDTHAWALQLTHNALGPRAVARLSSGVERVIWLDASVTRAAREALTRAFAEASEYDGTGQVADAGNRARVSLAANRHQIHFEGHGNATTTPLRSRVSARVVGADDAPGREHARPRVRRGDSRDARQDRVRLRHATLADAVRHRVD